MKPPSCGGRNGEGQQPHVRLIYVKDANHDLSHKKFNFNYGSNTFGGH